MEIRQAVPSEAVNQAAGHTLFVEGRSPEALDPKVLQRLLKGISVSVKPLGAASHIRSAAQALHPHHPNYYFIIDRDHYRESEVADSWGNFPDPATHNLLIWRKRRGKAAEKLVATELLDQDLQSQPPDFQELYKLITVRTQVLR